MNFRAKIVKIIKCWIFARKIQINLRNNVKYFLAILARKFKCKHCVWKSPKMCHLNFRAKIAKIAKNILHYFARKFNILWFWQFWRENSNMNTVFQNYQKCIIWIVGILITQCFKIHKNVSFEFSRQNHHFNLHGYFGVKMLILIFGAKIQIFLIWK